MVCLSNLGSFICLQNLFDETVQAIRNFPLTQQVSECPFCSQLIAASYKYECVFVWKYCLQPLAYMFWQIPSTPFHMPFCSCHTNLRLPRLGYNIFTFAHTRKHLGVFS